MAITPNRTSLHTGESATNAVVAVKDVELPPTRGLCMDAAGALKVTMFDGDAVVFPSGALEAGIIHPLSVVKVWTTGSGSQNIVLLY